MKTLEHIKNDYSVEQGFENWEDLIESHFFDGLSAINDLISHENEVMKIYAMECLKLASKNAWNGYIVTGMQEVADDVKESITNENNIIK